MGKKGFTLIEILVVVLIISILAAIALPQYEKAVLRAKAKEAQINLRPIAEAQLRYYMATGVWSEYMAALDIVPAGLKYFDKYIFHDEHVEVMGTFKGVEYWLTVFYNEVNTTYCGIVEAQTSIANPCAMISGDPQPRRDLYHGYIAYRI
jgi:type IV pilus assembly protein PilE